MSDEENAIKIQDKVTFIDSGFYAKKGVRMRLINRPYLWDFYRGNYPYVFLLGGRQIEKTSTLITESIVTSLSIEGFKTLYILPLEDQVHKISKNQFSDIINNTQFVKSSLKMILSVTEKTFKNQSKITFGYARDSADRIRGQTSDRLIIDEIQDIYMDILPVIRETYTHSRFGYEVMSGTAKLETSPTALVWKMSTGYDWAVRCPGCNKWQRLGPKNIGIRCPICKHCGKELRKQNVLDYPKNATWVSTQAPDSKIKGYRINQLMNPSILDKWSTFLYKLEMAEKTTGDETIANEFFGFHAGSGERPFNEEKLQNLCTNYTKDAFDKFLKERTYSARPVVMGIDWGGRMVGGIGKSNTAVVIMGFPTNAADMVILYNEIFSDVTDLEAIMAKIGQLVRRFGVAKIGVDMGMGVDRVPRLVRMFPGMVFPLYYSGVFKGFIGYNKQGYYTVNRTRAISLFLQDIKERRIKLPPWEYFAPVASDYLAIYQTYSGKPGAERSYYDKDAAATDDAFQAAIYARITWNIIIGNVLDVDPNITAN